MALRGWLCAALPVLVALSRPVDCQDESELFYNPIERSYAQVQPPLFHNTRPQSYFEHSDYTSQQKSYLDSGSAAGLPSPNYNQNPSPFQLPTGRSQPPGQYYINQADYTVPQKSRFRSSVPQNFQYVHQAVSTYRPENLHVHSAAYQRDPSRPETFLGQITLNNPDTDFLPANRFQSTQFADNSLRNTNFKAIPANEHLNGSNDDLFREHRVTTYNPNRVNIKHQRNTQIQTTVRPDHLNFHPATEESFGFDRNFARTFKSKSEPIASRSKNNDYAPTTLRAPIADNTQNWGHLFLHPAITTEHKGLDELEPFLEDNIEKNLENEKGSNNVEVIKLVTDNLDHSNVDDYDSNPSASSMNASNVSKESDSRVLTDTSSTKPLKPSDYIQKEKLNHAMKDYEYESEDNMSSTFRTSEITLNRNTHHTIDNDASNEQQTEELEYYDYESEEQNKEQTTEKQYTQNYKITSLTSEQTTDIVTPIVKPQSTLNASTTTIATEIYAPKSFEVVTLKPNHTMVNDDNFKEFIDSVSMDHTETVESTESHKEEFNSKEDNSSTDTDTSEVLRQEVVSVVTTKSVVNGTIAVPHVTFSPVPTKTLHKKHESPNVPSTTTSIPSSNTQASISTTTTENIFASVQTSRSVSGARFLPFPTIEQGDKKQILTDESYDNIDDDDDDDDDELSVTKKPNNLYEKSANNKNDSSSTESLNDKLDSIQSELSSSVLAGDFKNNDKNFAVVTEPQTKNEPTTSASTPIQLFTVKTITISSTTEKSAPEPLPVMIKKFGSHSRPTSTTTEKPKRKQSYVTVKVDDLSGLLPAGYKPRTSYKDKKKTSTTAVPVSISTITTTEVTPLTTDAINSTQGRSSGITNKNKVTIQSDISPALPKEYNQSKEKPTHIENIFSTFKTEDISKFLPPGFKLNVTSTTEPENKLSSRGVIESQPKVHQNSTTTTIRPKTQKFTTVVDKVDISDFLPKGFKLKDSTEDEKDIFKKVQITDLYSLLPSGYNDSKTGVGENVGDTKSDESSSGPPTTSKPSNGFKIVFPSRPGSKPARKTTTSKPVGGIGPESLTPTIHKGWPTRASTEFTGWPSPSTTPFSIEKLLEAQRNATATSAPPELSTEASTRRTTTTTSTPPPPAPSTTPGICRHDCDVAGTIKIVSGVTWVPELLDHHTDEWKKLAQLVKEELNSVYSKSDVLKKWYKGIRIDAFSKGSVLVDYFVELRDVGEKIDTVELKQLFHKSLQRAKPRSVVEEIREERPLDPDVMLGDQPDEERLTVTETVDWSPGKLEIGKFIVDPTFTEFIVLPKRQEPAVSKAEEDAFLPQWGIAVIVIALASLLFVVIFGVTVLVNRQKSSKAKQPIPLSEDMLRELDKSHMGGYDDMHLKERELPYPPSKQRRLSTTFIEPMAYPGAAGDSWRSEWTPQLQQYMQHYTPDSGRGSQLYGVGNPYGYSGSQLYGQTGAGGGGGGGGSLYGYTGDYPPHPRSHYSRRRSEYDANF